MDFVADLFMLAGAIFTMIGGIGAVRFSDLMSRMHAAAKAPTLGLLLAAIGASIRIGTGAAIATLVLVVVLQLLTSPVAAHVLARASYGQVDSELDGADELAEHLHRQADAAATDSDQDESTLDGSPHD